jgi:tripartite-type tricarboxylate transporter receptor subunit TctC
MLTRRTLLGASLALPTLARGASAQDFPNRPIRLVVPFAAGGQSDTVARLVAPKLGEALGQSVVIENRGGGGGALGAAAVAQAAPDGHTIMIESFSFAVAPLIHKNLPFDYATAFAPLAVCVSLPYVLLVKKDLPAQDLAGYLALARQRRGLTFGSPGIGTIGHLAGVLLAQRATAPLEHVAYRGGAQSAQDLAAGNIDSAIGTANTFRPLVEDGRVRGIALTTAERRGTLRQLPTIAESGFPGFDLASWNGLFAPAATPAPVRAKLEAATLAALADREVRTRLEASGNDVAAEGATAFAALIQRDTAVVRRIVAENRLDLST